MLTGCKKYVWLLLALVMTASTARAEYEDRYLLGDSMPNPLIYLPSPPDSTMLAINGDYAKWIWGKEMRNTPRGEQASWESKYGIVRMCAIFSEILDLNISEEEAPAIYRLMLRAGETGSGAVSAMKHAHFRRRPFLVMNEPTWGAHDSEEDLSNNSSYPSSHTGCGWGTALALAEMAPHLQDTILRRGYEYGISRVITGAHWQSDVDAAFTCASAAIARSHATSNYQTDMAAAKAEYMQIKGLSESEINTNSIPTANKIIPDPAKEDSYFFYGEVAPYWKAKDERNTERGNQAIIDADLTDDVIIGGFAQCAGINISSTTLPHTTKLLKTSKLMLGINAFMMKNYWYRNRPYVQLGENTLVPEDEDTYHNESSYPSGHAIIGWGMALVLTEVMPQLQNPILKRGYDIGWSRVIAGYHYPSDVHTGRVLAAGLVAKMHNEAYFKSLLDSAKQEIATTDANVYYLSANKLSRHESLDSLLSEYSSTTFTSDFYRWIWGKKMRNTERGEIARHDSQCGIEHLCSIYSGVLGIDIDESNTPSIYNIISQAANAGISSTHTMCVSRKRPYELMNEQPWGDNVIMSNLSDSVCSHPSAHAAMVWSTALALSQMAPHMQDTILARSMQCATSGVIAGMCWQTDVNSAFIYASAAIARYQAAIDFQADMAAAKAEYMQIKGLTENEIKTSSFPVITKIIDAPPTINDYLFVGDLYTYWQTKELRFTERGDSAYADASIDDNYLINAFAACSPVVTISESETPHICTLIKTLKLIFNSRATTLKSTIQRRRPYIQYKEPIVYGSNQWFEWEESSYPSRHALLGWAIALSLTEVMPEYQNEILRCGYEYGKSRIIIGSCYTSDVVAARVIAACDISKLHNDTLFKTLINNARNEYQQKLEDAAVESIVADSAQNPSAWYSINGIIYPTQPTQPGIYIHNGKKVVVRN